MSKYYLLSALRRLQRALILFPRIRASSVLLKPVFQNQSDIALLKFFTGWKIKSQRFEGILVRAQLSNWKMFRHDPSLVRQNGGVFNPISQFPDISGPGIVLQLSNSLRRKGGIFSGKAVKKVSSQRKNIFFAFA